MREVYSKTITDPNAPDRLKGKTLEAVFTLGRPGQQDNIQFLMDLPDDVTPNEIAYFRLVCGEVMDSIRENTKIQYTEHPPRKL